MDIETPVTFGGLIIASIFLLVVNFAPRFYDFLKLRAEMREREAQAKRESELRATEMEVEKEDRAWDTVIREYERALERGHKLERENEQLRPLALVNAVNEQKMKQCKEDKEDWKAHAENLEQQLKENNIVPRPFKRKTREDTQENLKTVSRKMKAVRDELPPENRVGTEGTPTLVFPTVQKGDKE